MRSAFRFEPYFDPFVDFFTVELPRLAFPSHLEDAFDRDCAKPGHATNKGRCTPKSRGDVFGIDVFSGVFLNGIARKREVDFHTL